MTLRSLPLLRTAVLAGAVLASGSALAAQQLLPANSRIAFTAKQLGVPLNGHFRQFDAQIAFDPARPEASRVRLDIATGSATLGSKAADSQLVAPDWFHTAQFPTARFESRSVQALGGGTYQVDGTLTLKGHSQTVSVPVTLAPAGGHTLARGTLQLQRLPFKIGDGDWADTSMVANEVTVHFELALTGIAGL